MSKKHYIKSIEDTEYILKSIDQERKELKDRQKEINTVIEEIKSKVLSSESKSTGQYVKYGSKPQSVSERMELIKAFVELQKLSVDINKTIITTYEREFKMSIDLSKYLDSKENDAGAQQALSPTELVKLVRASKKSLDNSED